MFAPQTGSSFQNFPWDPSERRVISHTTVPYLSYRNNFINDFPGTPADDFALLATRTLVVAAGNHQFCITSDDGSWLWIDSNQLLSNQGMHDVITVCKDIMLPAGAYIITVNYFQHFFGKVLEVLMDGSSIFPPGKAPASA